jgi:hypothetical protein
MARRGEFLLGGAWLGVVGQKRKEAIMETFGFGVIIISIVIAILLFLALREFFCWYFKINEHLKKQDEIIALLKTANKTGEKARAPLNSVEKEVYSETSITKEMIDRLTSN